MSVPKITGILQILLKLSLVVYGILFQTQESKLLKYSFNTLHILLIVALQIPIFSVFSDL